MASGGVGIKHSLASEQPLGSLIDVKVNRWVGNEQQLFLCAQVGVYTPDLSNNFNGNTEIQLYSLANLRTLAKFGR